MLSSRLPSAQEQRKQEDIRLCRSFSTAWRKHAQFYRPTLMIRAYSRAWKREPLWNDRWAYRTLIRARRAASAALSEGAARIGLSNRSPVPRPAARPNQSRRFSPRPAVSAVGGGRATAAGAAAPAHCVTRGGPCGNLVAARIAVSRETRPGAAHVAGGFGAPPAPIDVSGMVELDGDLRRVRGRGTCARKFLSSCRNGASRVRIHKATSRLRL